jgi:hypothetical protein
MSTKSENEMTDEELQQFEESTKVVEDVYDKLETLRKKLNDSRIEQMYVIKRSSKLGPTCPYYKKAKRLYLQEGQHVEILNLLSDILENLEET